MTTVTKTVRETPLIFTAESVRAILNGSKTQTRRVIEPQPDNVDHYEPGLVNEAWQSGHVDVRCPYGKPGERIWVKEPWQVVDGRLDQDYSNAIDDVEIEYVADKKRRTMAVGRRSQWTAWLGPEGIKRGVKSSMFMPRWASRITLEITDVTIERIQEISHDDVIAEGIDAWIDSLPLEKRSGAIRKQSLSLKQLAFSYLWDSINAKRGFGWDTNPWVWVISFKKVSQ